jgi:hypothetical protein
MQGIIIKKASIKDNNYLSVEYTEQQADGFSTIKKECKIPVHLDLITAFAQLDMHLTQLCYQYDYNGNFDEANVSYKAFTISGSADNEGVVLIGSRKLENDKLLNINSPFQKFKDDFFFYEFTDDLYRKLNNCKVEVIAYLLEGKHNESKQLELFIELEEANGL